LEEGKGGIKWWVLRSKATVFVAAGFPRWIFHCLLFRQHELTMRGEANHQHYLLVSKVKI
jgi:hypothetical protein